MKLQAFLILVFFSIQFSYSQEYIYKHFGVDEGLPSSEVYDVYQDKYGYIWFATDKGISRYNGYEFENFTTKDGLTDNTILDFYPQKDGRVWFYSYHTQSLFYFNEEFDGITSYKFNDSLKECFENNSVINSVKVDEEGAVAIGGYGIAGLIKISKEGEITRHFEGNDNVKRLPVNGVRIGVEIEKGLFFLYYSDLKSTKSTLFFDVEYKTSSRLDLVFLNKEQFLFIDRKLCLASKNGSVKYLERELNPIGIKRIDDDSFFVGYYSNGAEIRNTSGQILKKFLPKKSVSDFLIDKEGGYWFTTLNNGVFYIKNPQVKILHNSHIVSLTKDDKDVLFAGFSNGDILKYNKHKVETLHKGLKNNKSLVQYDKKNNHLFGYGDRRLVKYTDNNKSYKISAKKLPENFDNGLLGSMVNSFYLLKDNEIIIHKFDKKIQDVCAYKDAFLIGTSSGLYLQKDTIIQEHQPVKVLKSRIDDIDFNKTTNTLYMATQGEGVVVYNDSIYSIARAQGLTNNIISEVYIENDSTVWACSNTGLNRISFNANNSFDIATITKQDGLISNDIDDVEIINDTVWVATKKGLCYFNKDVLVKKETSSILSLSLKEVKVNKQSVSGENIKLKYNQNNIDFKLEAISHKNTNDVNYYYRLKEVDTTWSITKNRYISFPSLSPGKYTFEAKAKVFENPNRLMTTYNFKILPPFWKSWWFYGICFLLLSALIYAFFRVRVLTYNQDVFRELIRLAIKRLKRKELFYKFRANGEDFKIPAHDILFVNSQGNYLDIITRKKTYTIRCKIGDFISTTPDSLEYLRIHRSYIVRIDQVSSKGKNWVVIMDKKIPVGETYLRELDKIHF